MSQKIGKYSVSEFEYDKYCCCHMSVIGSDNPFFHEKIFVYASSNDFFKPHIWKIAFGSVSGFSVFENFYIKMFGEYLDLKFKSSEDAIKHINKFLDKVNRLTVFI